jgi:hypothetical protein
MEQSKNIPPRYAIRLEDLRAWHVIFATCAAWESGPTSTPGCCSTADRRTPGCSTSSASFAAAAAAITKATP